MSSSASTNNSKNVGDKVLIMYYKDKPSQSFLLVKTIVPDSYLDKDTVWNEPPYFINIDDLN